ncbi:MAG: hypothetical protein V3W19_03690 [Desulfatiglandales bacterium]
MFGKRIKLFKLLGFEVRIDWSWIIIVILVVWSQTTGLFPFHLKNFSPQTYWLMGIAGALGLFLSIIVPEKIGTRRRRERWQRNALRKTPLDPRQTPLRPSL